MKLEPAKFCPLINADCKGLGCSWFTQIRGTHPNTGEPVDEWNCAITWLPVLLIENSNQQRKTTATVDSLRGEVYHQQQDNVHILQSLLMKTNQRALLE